MGGSTLDFEWFQMVAYMKKKGEGVARSSVVDAYPAEPLFNFFFALSGLIIFAHMG